VKLNDVEQLCAPPAPVAGKRVAKKRRLVGSHERRERGDAYRQEHQSDVDCHGVALVQVVAATGHHANDPVAKTIGCRFGDFHVLRAW